VIGGTRPTTENHDTQLAYAAGLFDATGEIIHEPNGDIALRIANTHYEAIIRVQFALGEGNYNHSGHSHQDINGIWHHSPTMHHLKIRGPLEVMYALEDLLPYLICKKREAWETYKHLKQRQLDRAYAKLDLLHGISAPKTRYMFT